MALNDNVQAIILTSNLIYFKILLEWINRYTFLKCKK